MNILIIGGKRFVGYHIANACIKNGHTVTFFNRGRTNKELFSEYENIIGDRNNDIELLKGLTFDYVIDTCAYFPKQVEDTLHALNNNFKRYLLISTLSVINEDTFNHDETVQTKTPDYDSKEITAATYGPLKSACEEVLLKHAKEKALIIRPGYIVGDKDYTDRFTYYAIMMHFNKEVIMPITNDLRYSFIDGEDLGKFCINVLEKNLSGIYHTVGPKELYFKDFIEIVKNTVNKDCNIHYKNETFLKEHNVMIHQAFPTCNLNKEGNNVFSANIEKALNAGLTLKPIEQSIKEALAYFLEEKGDISKLEVGMNQEEMIKLINEK